MRSVIDGEVSLFDCTLVAPLVCVFVVLLVLVVPFWAARLVEWSELDGEE